MPYRIRSVTKKNVALSQSPVEDAREWGERLHERLGTLLAAATAILVVSGIAVSYFYIRSRNAEKASDAFSQASALYRSGENSGADSRATLERAVQAFSNLEEVYPGSFQAKMAAYYAGNAKFATGDVSGAVAAYRSFLTRYPDEKEIGYFVMMRLALALENMGNGDEAIKTFEKLAQTTQAPNRDQAYFEQGKLLEARSQNIAAVTAYEELAKNLPESPLAAAARERIRILGGGTTGKNLPGQGSSP